MTLHRLASRRFQTAASAALADPALQASLSRLKGNFLQRRARARASLPQFDALSDTAAAIRAHTLQHLDLYLEAFEKAVGGAGGEVHWARDDREARRILLALCRRYGARTVTKGKTMAGEEIGLNPFFEAHGIVPVETDLGEYIVQLGREPPSHIIAPAIHRDRAWIARLFARHHRGLPALSPDDTGGMLAQARKVLRRRFLEAEVGITGANMLIAQTGQAAIVTNEGNGDLTRLMPRAHIVLAGIEKLVPTLADAGCLLRVLARSATGQEMSAYTTFCAGPRREGESDGPEAFHVVLLDNGRSALAGTPLHDILRCIRCGCCLNACPVYGKVGGHAYGSPYPGPMGAVLTPALAGLGESFHLPQASSLCGRCREVCPVQIDIPAMLRHLRERHAAARAGGPLAAAAMALWAALAARPRLWRRATSAAASLLHRASRGRGRFSSLPLAGGWTAGRDLASPQGASFQHRWARGERPWQAP